MSNMAEAVVPLSREEMESELLVRDSGCVGVMGCERDEAYVFEPDADPGPGRIPSPRPGECRGVLKRVKDSLRSRPLCEDASETELEPKPCPPPPPLLAESKGEACRLLEEVDPPPSGECATDVLAIDTEDDRELRRRGRWCMPDMPTSSGSMPVA